MVRNKQKTKNQDCRVTFTAVLGCHSGFSYFLLPLNYVFVFNQTVVLCLQTSSSISKICNTPGHSLTFSANASSVRLCFMAESPKQQERYHVFLHGRHQLVIINLSGTFISTNLSKKQTILFSFLHVQLNTQLGSNISLLATIYVCWVIHPFPKHVCGTSSVSSFWHSEANGTKFPSSGNSQSGERGGLANKECARRVERGGCHVQWAEGQQKRTGVQGEKVMEKVMCELDKRGKIMTISDRKSELGHLLTKRI